jgi:hypothetical protein
VDENNSYETFLNAVNNIKDCFDKNDLSLFDDLIEKAIDNHSHPYNLNESIRTISDLFKSSFFKKSTAPILLQNPDSLGKMCVIPITNESVVTIMGDTHGDFGAFSSIVLESNIFSGNKDYHLIILGDVIDRGPHPLENFIAVLYLLFTHPEQVIFIPGNHEYEAAKQNYSKTFSFSSFFAPPSKKNSSGSTSIEKITAFINSCPCQAITHGSFNCFLSHGGIATNYKDEVIEKSSSGLILQDLLTKPINAYWSDYDQIIVSQIQRRMNTFQEASDRIFHISLSIHVNPQDHVQIENYNGWLNILNQWKALPLQISETKEGLINTKRGTNKGISYTGANACQAVYDLCGEITTFIDGHGHFCGKTEIILNDNLTANIFTIHSTEIAKLYSMDIPIYGKIENSKFNFIACRSPTNSSSSTPEYLP